MSLKITTQVDSVRPIDVDLRVRGGTLDLIADIEAVYSNRCVCDNDGWDIDNPYLEVDITSWQKGYEERRLPVVEEIELTATNRDTGEVMTADAVLYLNSYLHGVASYEVVL